MSLIDNKAGSAAVDPADYNALVDAVIALQASPSGGSAWTDWIDWDYTDYVGPDPGINGAANSDGIPIDVSFAVGDVVQRIMLVVETTLDNLVGDPQLIPSIGRLAPGVYDYLDGGDTLNEVEQVYPGAVGTVAMSEPNQIAPLSLLKAPVDDPGLQQSLAIRTAGGGAVEVLASDVIVWLGSSFTDPPTQGHGRIRFEVIPA